MKASAPDERKWYLAAKLLTDRLNAEEQSEWESAIQDERFRSDFELVRKHWSKYGTLPYNMINKEGDWNLVLQKIRGNAVPAKRFDSAMLLRYAAAVTFFLVASVGVWAVLRNPTGEKLMTTIHAPNGTRTLITLPDSSSVWLNAGSKMSYDQDFGQDNRAIALEGEAFFDVRRKAVPFSVKASDFYITVLGTAFNVKAYPDEDIVSTTLLRGSLKVKRVTASGKEEEFLLSPSEKLLLKGTDSSRANEAVILQKVADAASEADWKDGWLTVRGESLDELAKKIERIYNVKVIFEDESLKTYRYNGRIQQLSLEQVLNALALTSPVRFVIDESSVILRENPETRSRYQTQQP